MGFGFAREARLVRRGEFTGLLKDGRRRRGHWFTLFVSVRSPGSAARLGEVAPKRYAPKAVQRNLVKRIAREQFRRIRGELGPIDVLLQLRQRLPAIPLDALKGPLAVDAAGLLLAAPGLGAAGPRAGGVETLPDPDGAPAVGGRP